MKTAATAAAAFVFFASNALAQYCPQGLYGQMNGSYYYYCLMCMSNCNQSCYVVTDAAHDTGGGCPCAMNCTDPINEYRPIEKQVNGGKVSKETKASANAANTTKDDFIVLPAMGAQSKYISYGDKFCAPVPSIKAVPASEVTLEINENNTQYYFRCIEVVDSTHPGSVLIGQQLEKKPPAGMPLKQAVRKKGSDGPSKNYHHRIQVSDPDDATDTREFDVISLQDLDPTS